MAAPMPSTVSFEYLFDTLQADADVREKIREAVKALERDERGCLSVLNRVHVVGPTESESSFHLTAARLLLALLGSSEP